MKKINPDEIKGRLVRDLEALFGVNLLSVVMHGSAAASRYIPGISDINILCVLRDDSLDIIASLAGAEKKWRSYNVRFSYIFTPQYINESLDSYPLEFMEIKEAHRVLSGDDFFSRLEIGTEHLRLQCERELKGKLLHLKREYISSGGKKRAIASLIRTSFPQLVFILRGVIYASGGGYESGRGKDVCRRVSELPGLKIEALVKIAEAGSSVRDSELCSLFPGYVKDISRIIEAVDKSLEK